MPEDRLSGRGRRIAIRFVVFPARGPSPAPDPVVYFAGGPGGSAIGDIPGALSQLSNLNQSRDLVFIDQRGTGGSHPLMCPSPPMSLERPAQVHRRIESCLASLRGRADLRFYTTAMAAGDVAQVLTDLHYRKVNIFGGSYGATAAQIFLQLFPARVRTMTLLGGTVLSIPLFERFPQASQHALDAILTRCRRDKACRRAFPRLSAEWTTVRSVLAERPVALPGAITPTHTALTLDDSTLASGVHALLLSANTAVYIPLLIHSVYVAHGRPAALSAVIRQLSASRLLAGSGQQALIGYPIRCAEPWARLQPGRILDRASYYYQSSLNDAKWWQDICPLIPAAGAAAGYGRQRPSSVPVLMINGTADPQDPPANMAGARRFWPNSRLVVEPGQGHSIDANAWSGCDAGLVHDFVVQASSAKLDTSCLSLVVLPSFPLHW